jgi:hypothetical protein
VSLVASVDRIAGACLTASLAMDDELTQAAERLLGQWSALSMQHIALGASCGCGMGGISLRLEDFELDIVGYLEDAGLRSGLDEVAGFFSAMQQDGPQTEPLRRLLGDALTGRLPGAVAAWLLPKVDRTLRSFAELHGQRTQD